MPFISNISAVNLKRFKLASQQRLNLHGREPRHASTSSRAAARAPRCCPEVRFERVDEPRLGSGCLGRRQAGGLSEQQTFVSSQFRRLDEPDRGLAGSASGEGHLRSSQTATFSLRPRAGAESGGREQARVGGKLSGASSHKDANGFRPGPPS